MEDDLLLKTTFDWGHPLMEDYNEDNLKNKEDLHIAARDTVLDIFRFAVFSNQALYICLKGAT